MIIRIMGEGQLRLPESSLEQLNRLDVDLESAVEKHDDAAFSTALHALLEAARSLGEALPEDAIEPSDLILPGEGATIEEVHELLTDGGLIPG
jgi:hypothetical protein